MKRTDRLQPRQHPCWLHTIGWAICPFPKCWSCPDKVCYQRNGQNAPCQPALPVCMLRPTDAHGGARQTRITMRLSTHSHQGRSYWWTNWSHLRQASSHSSLGSSCVRGISMLPFTWITTPKWGSFSYKIQHLLKRPWRVNRHLNALPTTGVFPYQFIMLITAFFARMLGSMHVMQKNRH